MNKINPRPKSVKSLKDYKLKIEFNNEEIRIYDVKPLLDLHIFKALIDDLLFNSVHITDDGMAIEWDNGADLCADEVYINSELSEDYRLAVEVDKRMENATKSHYFTREEVLREFGVVEEDLKDIEVDIEE